ALAHHARTQRKPPGADEPADRAAPDRLRHEAAPAMGNFGIRLQRPRPGTHLPVFELRRPRTWPETRAWRRPRRRALRDGAGDDGRSARGLRQSGATGGGRWARPIWFLRGFGLHAEPRAG